MSSKLQNVHVVLNVVRLFLSVSSDGFMVTVAANKRERFGIVGIAKSGMLQTADGSLIAPDSVLIHSETLAQIQQIADDIFTLIPRIARTVWKAGKGLNDNARRWNWRAEAGLITIQFQNIRGTLKRCMFQYGTKFKAMAAMSKERRKPKTA